MLCLLIELTLQQEDTDGSSQKLKQTIYVNNILKKIIIVDQKILKRYKMSTPEDQADQFSSIFYTVAATYAMSSSSTSLLITSGAGADARC